MFQTGFKGSLYWNRRGIYKIKEMRQRIILASVVMQGHGTTGGTGVALIDHVVHEVYQSRVTYKYWNSSQFTWPTKGWTIAYHPGWKLCTQSSMSKNKRILRIAARASQATKNMKIMRNTISTKNIFIISHLLDEMLLRYFRSWPCAPSTLVNVSSMFSSILSWTTRQLIQDSQ